MSRIDENILDVYANQIKKIPLLTPQEENELAVLAQKGDINARNKILSANLRFVLKIAQKYSKSQMELEDLVSEGNLGLINAIEHFNPEMGNHFISYAVFWIRQSILKAVGEKSRAIRLPQNKAYEVSQVIKAREMLPEMDSEQEIKEIGLMLDMKNSEVKELLQFSKDMLSLDAPAAKDGESSYTLGQLLEDQTYSTPEAAFMSKSFNDDIHKLVENLPGKESEVISMRFGLYGQEPKSLQEIGNKFDLSKERVRQIEKKAIFDLSKKTKAASLREFFVA